MPTRFVAPAQVVLDANGDGQVVVGPSSADWLVRTTSVSTSTAVKRPTVILYLGGISDATFLEGTNSGSGDISNTEHLMVPGDLLYAVWAGGDAGARATLRVAGIAYSTGEGIEAF